jgi:hypothetical protein
MDMARFEDEDDSGYIAVIGELRRWNRELSSANTGVRVPAIGLQRQPVHQDSPKCA